MMTEEFDFCFVWLRAVTHEGQRRFFHIVDNERGDRRQVVSYSRRCDAVRIYRGQQGVSRYKFVPSDRAGEIPKNLLPCPRCCDGFDPRIVHRCPPEGEAETPCCGRIVFELPSLERISTDPQLVTCDGPFR